jgi:PEP-CTERM motif
LSQTIPEELHAFRPYHYCENHLMCIRRRVLSALVALIACIVTPGYATAGIVTNGGFETGDFTGWTLSGNTDFVGVTTGIAHTGDYAAYFGSDGSLGFLSQNLATTAGTTYELNFFLASDGQTPSDFQVTFGGATFDQTDLPMFSYVSQSLTVTATGSSTLLQFGFRDDNGFLNLDDVSVIAVPEPGSLVLLCLGASISLTFRNRKLH